MPKPYRLCLTFLQETDGDIDNRTLSEEFSDDVNFHLIKTQVWTEELTAALERITKRLTDAGLAVGNGDNPGKPSGTGKAKAKR